MAVAALALITRTWLVEGLVDPLIVSGGSMAPALRGTHRQVTCSHCGFAFACGEESLPSDMLARCPNCGAKSDLKSLPVQPGDRLIIDRVAYDLSHPQRWDIAVLRTPDDPQSLCVKRVVGLPGETVEIRDGDVYVDGQIAPRSMPQMLATAIPVYDASCRPADGRSAQARASAADSRWQRTAVAGGFACSPELADADVENAHPPQADPEQGIDWLVYRHEQTIAGRPVNQQVGPILDDLSYNQNESRELVAVHDVILQCRVRRGRVGPVVAADR